MTINKFQGKTKEEAIQKAKEELGENAVIDATNENAINLPSSEQVEGFFAKIWHWFTVRCHVWLQEHLQRMLLKPHR